MTTAKQKVLKRYPKAYALKYWPTLQFVIITDFRNDEISAYRSRERDAWADAAKDGTFSAGCHKHMTRSQALKHWDDPSRQDDRAILFTLAIGLHS